VERHVTHVREVKPIVDTGLIGDPVELTSDPLPQFVDPPILPPDPPPVRQIARAKGDVRTLFDADDYPESARRNEETGTVQARLEIAINGKVTGCSIVTSSGSAALDSATCRVLKARARFAPARDNAGNPISDSYVTPRIVWRIEGQG
jgi:protein TonB